MDAFLSTRAPRLLGRSSVRSALRSRSRSLLHTSAARHDRARAPPPAFVFDIDGVLKRGEEPIPRALEALALLSGRNASGRRLPVVLCTNGGGVTDERRARALTAQLGIEVTPRTLCQSATPLRRYAGPYGDRAVLAIGGAGEAAREVARSLGFRHVYLPQDLMRWRPAIYPWARADAFDATSDAPLPDFATVRFAAALVVHDSLDFGRDIQILHDVLTARDGCLGAGPKDPADPDDDADAQWTAAAQPALFFSNPDLLWANDYAAPRFGQGAFQAAFRAVFRATTGREPYFTVGGKPSRLTYDHLKTMLREHPDGDAGLGNIYMIGDNVRSDIAGAVAAGWRSCLVRTGVYRDDGPRARPPDPRPSVIVDDALDAVRWALEQEEIEL